MKKFFADKKRIIGLILVMIFVIAAAGFGIYEYWYYQKPKFHDLTIELGTDSVSITDFMTEYAKVKKSSFVTDVSEIDLNQVGETELVLAHGKKQETVYLYIEDTTAPTVEFIEKITVPLDYEPDPMDFISAYQDYSEVRIFFAEELPESDTYQDVTAVVTAEDASGNSVSCECLINYEWMTDSYTLEIGDTLTKEDLLLNKELGAELIDQADIDAINESAVGTYEIESTSGDKSVTCVVYVEDTVAPDLELQEVHIYENDMATLDDFVVSAADASGEVTVSLLTEIENGVVGNYTITIEAEDVNGNKTTKDTVFEVKEDDEAPVFSGLSDISQYERKSEPDYTTGVSAVDYVEGTCEYTCDAGSVDCDTPGTYYVTYTASDSKGNTITEKRKVIIKKDDVAPEISGSFSDISLEKNSSAPNYLKGVSATDNVDGTVSVSGDDSSVKYNKAGTYYVVYTAADSRGNTTTKKRKVTINHDSDDTDALVASIASELGNDPSAIRNYVRDRISYTTNWGGDDPVWYGFTVNSGNCYVHAHCLKAIFDYKGIESQLIWTTDKSHYWLIVKIGDGWKHIDATPGAMNRKYTLMSDAERLETLDGRTWDTSAWPACE